MKLLASLFVVVAMMLLPCEGSDTEGSDSDSDEHFIMYGPQGEVVDEDTNFVYFEDDNGVPQKAYLTSPNVSHAPIPQITLSSTVRFHLYTRDTVHRAGERLYIGEDHNLRTTRFNPQLPTKMLIHGFTNTIQSPAIQEPMKAYMRTGEYNVIGVDWGDHCRFPWYESARGNTVSVGIYVAKLLRYLIERTGVSPRHIHVIGHSLGAHVAGIAGYSLGNLKLGRISGLDPAGPSYGSTPDTDMLDSTDGDFVDVIHTCGGSGLPYLGLIQPSGMADFYPNGGQTDQPGCDQWFPWKRLSCSHSKAHELWTESIHSPGKFRVQQCDSLFEATSGQCRRNAAGVMGDKADPSMHGVYWLKTL